MAAEADQLHSLSNPLATIEQLKTSSSQLDGVPHDLELSLRFAGARLIQASGILLRLPQEIIAQAIVIFYRFYLGPEGGSFRINALKDVAAASLYLTAKPSFHPLSPRSILNVHAYLLSPASPLHHLHNHPPEETPDPTSHHLSESAYQTAKTTLIRTESLILRTLGFSTHVTTPHHLALTYLSTLGVLPQPPTPTSKALAKRTLAHLNTALLSPQLLYLTHQPSALAVSAVYLAAREVGVSLGGEEWWGVFDVGREELGFLTVGLLSAEEWVRVEGERWREGGEGGRGCPVTVEGLEVEVVRREGGEV